MMWQKWSVAALVVLALLLPSAGAGPASCTVVDGTGIAGVQVGMAIQAALNITGPPIRQQTEGAQVTYFVRPPLAYVVAEYGIVRRIGAQAAECRTTRGVAVGATLAEVRSAYASEPASIVYPVGQREVLSYPFAGVAFVALGGRVEIIEVFRPEAIGRATPPPPLPISPATGTPRGPTPTPTTAPGSWRVISASARLDGTTLIVSGVVENRGAARAAYAEVRALDASGRLLGQGDAHLRPNPVPSGATARFEVPLTVTGTPKEFVVRIRPLDSPNITLAQFTGEFKDLKQLGPLIAQQLQVTVEPMTPVPNPNSFIVRVTNGSPATVESVTISVQVTATCRVPASGSLRRVRELLTALAPPPPSPTPPPPTPTPPPTPPPTPVPTPRTIQEQWTGTAVVQQLKPGATTQAPLRLSGGVCLEFTSWSASSRVEDLKIGD
ncbi:MAG: hypothetical protein HY355_00510 [Armatimonadetes bacterium]|nr:hypothetical protein [Armatimonadota bacterium]